MNWTIFWFEHDLFVSVIITDEPEHVEERMLHTIERGGDIEKHTENHMPLLELGDYVITHADEPELGGTSRSETELRRWEEIISLLLILNNRRKQNVP